MSGKSKRSKTLASFQEKESNQDKAGGNRQHPNPEPIVSRLPTVHGVSDRFLSGLGTEELIQAEQKVLRFWQDNQIFEKRREQNSAGPLFRFIDGPITANNPMGIHHAWGRALKDIVHRYKALQGHHMQYQPGFDCQGLWVEVQVEKALGFKTKSDIEAFGLDNFSRECRERVEKFSAIQTDQSKRLGMWFDFNNAYYTHTDQNIEGIWKFLTQCHENGWLYKDHKIMPWSPRTQTSLSEHEMAGSYRDLTHTAATVKAFSSDLQASLVIWTTTPWTLSANSAIAVHPERTYCKVAVEGEEHPLIVSQETLKALLKGRKHTILEEVPGAALLGSRYEPFLTGLDVQKEQSPKVVPWSEVAADEGSGLVHIAPGCGPEDFELGKKLNLPIISPTDEEGRIIQGFGKLEGLPFTEASSAVLEDLKNSGKLFETEEVTHSCAVCWRSGAEVIYRIVDEWFIASDEIRPKLLEAIKEVEWNPPHIEKRMQNWLENMGDWCISRKRYWGLPLPIYEDESGKEVIVIASKNQLRELALQPELVDKLPELHRPWIDEIKIRSPETGNILERVAEVGDCWLDAGITPIGTRGLYSNPEKQEGWAPADYVVEMSEQTRLWFYSMLYMSVALKGTAPYKSVWTHERVTNEDGTRFSKTGTMIEFNEAADKMGADVIRYLFAKQRLTSDVPFGYNIGDEIRQKLLGYLNSVTFFKTYADIDRPDIPALTSGASSHILDQWLNARTGSFLAKFKQACDASDYARALSEFEGFSDELSNFYIRASRRRFWKGDLDQEKLSAYAELFFTLRSTNIVISPVVPFLSEATWQDVIRKLNPDDAESVHLASWPNYEDQENDSAVLRGGQLAGGIMSLGHACRIKAQVKARQPLNALELVIDNAQWELVQPFLDVIKNELNVKQVMRQPTQETWFEDGLGLDLSVAGPHFRDRMGDFKAFFANCDDSQKKEIAEQIAAGKESVNITGWSGVAVPVKVFNRTQQAKPDLVINGDEKSSLYCALDTLVTPALRQEGIAREILRNVQVLRKEAGLEIVDRIELEITTSDPDTEAAWVAHRKHIEEEALAISVDEIDSASCEKVCKINSSSTVTLRLKLLPTH